MRFIGNKELIAPDIYDLLDRKGLTTKDLTVFDAFCGTGAVSDTLKSSFNVISNDLLSWCVIYTQGRVHANECDFKLLGFDPFDYFNSCEEAREGFFYKNYSPGGSKRMYFSDINAARIDFFRHKIEEWYVANLLTQDEYSFLLASLIDSISKISNTAGVYGAYLKHWDPRSKKSLILRRLDSRKSNKNNTHSVQNQRVEDIISEIDCDVLYLDPPYTQNQYGTQYHLLETLILNDNPSISKITGSRYTAPMRSDWSKADKAHILLDKILATTKAKYIVMSYNQDGLMSKSFIEASLKRYGKADSYSCTKISYKKYSNFKSRDNRNHFEYLFFIEKKQLDDVTYTSPLNYIGSKARMIRHIKTHMPEKIDGFIDAFGGGFNVGINMNTDSVIYNDINHFVAQLVESFRKNDTYQYLLYIRRMIKKFDLEPRNSLSYLKARDYYNALPMDKRDPKLLFVVILYGYNQQIRFNGNHDFNNPVGMRWFNDKVLEKMISFSRVIKDKNIVFRSQDYETLCDGAECNYFSYLDPPYMLTNGAYNDGKRGFHGWSTELENRLFLFADGINSSGRLFMLSYVLEHKGIKNERLESWIKDQGYSLIQLDPIPGIKRKEVLVVNYG